MPLLTDEEFKSILPINLKNYPLIDRSVYDIIYSFNDFHDVDYGLSVAVRMNSPELAKVMLDKGGNIWNTGIYETCLQGNMDLFLLLINTALKKTDLPVSQLNKLIFTAAKGGNINIIHWLQQKNCQDWNSGLAGSCEGGHLEIVRMMFNMGVNNYTLGLMCAGSKKQKKIVDFILEHCQHKVEIIDWNACLMTACEGGDPELVHLMISRGANNWNDGLFYACREGHDEIVELIINMGANDWNLGLRAACIGRKINIIKLMFLLGVADYNYGLYGSCFSGWKEMIQLFISLGANDWSHGLFNACCGGHQEIAQWMIDLGANNLNLGLYGSCLLGQDYNFIHHLINLGANDFNGALSAVCRTSNRPLAEMLINLGASDWNRGLYEACCENQIEMAEWMLELGATNVDQFNQTFKKSSFIRH